MTVNVTKNFRMYPPNVNEPGVTQAMFGIRRVSHIEFPLWPGSAQDYSAYCQRSNYLARRTMGRSQSRDIKFARAAVPHVRSWRGFLPMARSCDSDSPRLHHFFPPRFKRNYLSWPFRA